MQCPKRSKCLMVLPKWLGNFDHGFPSLGCQTTHSLTHNLCRLFLASVSGTFQLRFLLQSLPQTFIQVNFEEKTHFSTFFSLSAFNWQFVVRVCYVLRSPGRCSTSKFISNIKFLVRSLSNVVILSNKLRVVCLLLSNKNTK